MTNFIANIANGYTLIDMILIIGFAAIAFYYFRKNQQAEEQKVQLSQTLNKIINELETEIMNRHHNTTNEVGQTLIDFEEKALKQDDKVFGIFQDKKELTASMAWGEFGNGNVPITSIRRAITNLVRSGMLMKTEVMKMGIYGKPEHVYRLKTA